MGRLRGHGLGLVVLVVGLVGVAVPAQGQATAATHIGYVADRFDDTPGGRGLLATAMAEAETAARNAQQAVGSSADLAAVKEYVGNVLHAVDPTAMARGPGLGYGVKRASEGVVRHIEMAASAPDASDDVQTYARQVATSAGNTVQRVAEIVSLGRRVMAATSAETAGPWVRQLAAVTRALIDGADANGDGRVGWQEGEGGLRQAREALDRLGRGLF